VDAIPGAGPHAAVAVASDSVGDTGVDFAEDPAIGECGVLLDVEGADMPRTAGVGDVENCLVRGEAEAIGFVEVFDER
jgi:hypothetical protein